MNAEITTVRPGDRVRVTQQLPRRADAWAGSVEGVVVSFGPSKAKSWFAHSRDDCLWLDRLELRKDDGEIIFCNLDQYSRIDVLEQADDS